MRTHEHVFLDEMNLLIPWTQLLVLIAPHTPAGKTGRPQFSAEVMLPICLLLQFFWHLDPAMHECVCSTDQGLAAVLIGAKKREIGRRFSAGFTMQIFTHQLALRRALFRISLDRQFN